MIRARIALVAIAMIAAGSTGCRSGSPYEAETQQPHTVGLVVKNDNYTEMDVYAVSDGLPTRIGTVTGLTTRSFWINDSYVGGTDFRVVATPVGGNGRASTGPILAATGQTIYFNINSMLRASTVSIR